MKRTIYILFIIFISIAVISISIKPIIIFLVKRQLSNVFIDSKVTISGCNIKPLHLLTLSDIEIKKDSIYSFKLKNISIHYGPFSIIRRNILKVSLGDAKIMVNLPQNSILEFSKHFNLKTNKSMFLVNALELSNFSLILDSKDLSLQANISSEINLIHQLVNYLDFKIYSLESRGFQLKDAFFKVNQSLRPGLLYIDQVKYNKLKIEKIESSVRLEDKSLCLDSLSAEFLGGKIQGNASLKTEKNGERFINLEFMNVDLNTLVNDFNLNEKVQINGRLGGAVTLKGTGLEINVLDGDFTTAEPGGTLTIKDTGFLEKIARNSNQPLDILVESFKDYHYNTGVMRLSLEGDSLILVIDLEGETGKRNLNIVVHNFKLRREK